MTVQYKFFKVGIMAPEPEEAQLNLFLRQHRIIHVQREFVGFGENSFWCFAVEYIDGESQTDGTSQTGSGMIFMSDKNCAMNPGVGNHTFKDEDSGIQ